MRALLRAHAKPQHREQQRVLRAFQQQRGREEQDLVVEGQDRGGTERDRRAEESSPERPDEQAVEHAERALHRLGGEQTRTEDAIDRRQEHGIGRTVQEDLLAEPLAARDRESPLVVHALVDRGPVEEGVLKGEIPEDPRAQRERGGDDHSERAELRAGGRVHARRRCGAGLRLGRHGAPR